MSEITVELDENTMAALGRQAAAHGRSPAAEAAEIVRRDCAPSAERDAFLRRAAQTVQREPGATFDRANFLRRARELALKSRGLHRSGPAEQRQGER